MAGPGIPLAELAKFQQNFDSCDKNRLAQNACTAQLLGDVLVSRAAKQTQQHCFNHQIEMEGKPMTNQKHSGRCWIFACLNLMRLPFMKKYNLSEFEFSHNYLYFWDKVERANYLLDAFIECARNGETPDGRLISFLLRNPSEDGGQWDMLTCLVEKYGVVPKVAYPEAANSENSVRLGRLLNNRLREYCMKLHKLVTGGASEDKIQSEKKQMTEEIYKIMCIILGTPPSQFTFQYYSRGDDRKYGEIGPISPRDFYHQLIKPELFDMEEMVCIVNDPRPENSYDKLYTVKYLGNMTGGRPVAYVNKPVHVLKELARKMLIDLGQPVWFGCDVGKQFYGKEGYLDLNIMDYKLMFGIDSLHMDKAERLIYGESLMTHAMVFTAVNTTSDEKGNITGANKWRVENSWGDDAGDKGYLSMTDDWFTEFVYEVVINKKLLDPASLAILDQEPVVLPAWDPMGALANP